MSMRTQGRTLLTKKHLHSKGEKKSGTSFITLVLANLLRYLDLYYITFILQLYIVLMRNINLTLE